MRNVAEISYFISRIIIIFIVLVLFDDNKAGPADIHINFSSCCDAVLQQTVEWRSGDQRCEHMIRVESHGSCFIYRDTRAAIEAPDHSF